VNPVPATPRTVHVEHCMGTVFSIDIRDAGEWSAALACVAEWLHRVDATFSTYRADSPVSRLGRDDIALADCPPEVAEVLAACTTVTKETDGYFTAYPGGRLDPSGYVKGWAIERASTLLREHGSMNHAVNGGGDTQCAGERAPGQPWRIGLSHPLRPGQLTAIVELVDGAIATSGTSERGAHVINPKTGLAATDLASISVVGTSLTLVDAYATAGLAMGLGSLAWLSARDGYEALLVTPDGRARRTPGFRAAAATS
jgi:thiamine biosynthesis lipoprotein